MAEHDDAVFEPDVEMSDPKLLVDQRRKLGHFGAAALRHLEIECARKVQRLNLRHPCEGNLIVGRWTDYQVSFTWMPEIEALHLACAFDLKVPERRRAEVTELAALINEQLWVGHFDVWFKDGIIMFRHALVLTGGITAADAQCEALLGMALNSCERHYQAFQFVLWAGKSPREALESIMFETRGEA